MFSANYYQTYFFKQLVVHFISRGVFMEVPIYYDEEEEWQRALLLYDAVLKEICTKIEILNNEFKLAHQYNPIEHISSRIKSADSIARKMRINNRELTVENIIRYVNDVAGYASSVPLLQTYTV